MADTTLEIQGLRLVAKDLGSLVYALETYDMSGGAGVADSSVEVQGYRVLAHDNGDGTFSPVVTTSTGVGDVSVEWQGLRIKLHPTGINATIGGVVIPTYAIVVYSV